MDNNKLYKGNLYLQHKEIEQGENWLQKGLSDDTLAYNAYYQLSRKRVVNMSSNGKSYLQSIVKDHSVASINVDILGGLPSLKGTRIPISTILACFADEMNIDEICEDYDLTPEQIKSSLKFVIDVLNRPYYEG
ncbi:hypothetical protein BK767_26290 [Bacillus thuringiensis serovar kyushuensis]|uniref:DUF433 domain-containing protein n=1 Tax=Bacillus thuringiensis TaxID=1428 RepID=UPI000B43E746|nr:DUF433 domain-containing protein [Bacillus thuringiensis]MEC2861585.1 DUF433 domain-containing protein [Bacillus cereus]OTZ63542.1 hypothetical protein BK767_26290 [Bacillus thuringiensis serovar kyushuensis]OTZ73985.1 hypothetical protein BK768_14710 [Bacillus thuringiensis serovar tohokuensis]